MSISLPAPKIPAKSLSRTSPKSDLTTYEEARINIKEAIELYLETMTQEEIEASLNKEIITTTLEINFA